MVASVSSTHFDRLPEAYQAMITMGHIHEMTCAILNAENTVLYADPDFMKSLDLELPPEGVAGKDIIGTIDLIQTLETSNSEIVSKWFANAGKSMGTGSLNRLDVKFDNDGKSYCLAASLTQSGDRFLTIRDCSLQAHHKRLLDVSQAISLSGYWYINLETKKITLSEHLSEGFTSLEKQKIDTNGFWDLLHPDDVELTRKSLEDGIRSKVRFSHDCRIVSERHGTFWARNIIEPELDSAGNVTGIIVFAINIDRDKTIQKSLEKSLADMEDSVKAKTKLIADVSHELRTPLNGIIGMADSLNSFDFEPDIQRRIDIINLSAGNLMRVINEILTHAKDDRTETRITMETANPITTIQGTADLWVEKSKENGTELICNIDQSVPSELNFDAIRFQQCLSNILSNAIKFTKNGVINIVAKRVEKPGRPPLLCCIVQDTGIGISKDDLGRIFERYQQADSSISNNYGGTGLGLSITKEIMELMGGQVLVKSNLGEGTTFLLTLPLDAAAASPVAYPVTPAETVPHFPITGVPSPAPAKPDGQDDTFEALKDLKILCVDDNDINRELIGGLIGNHVDTMVFAEDGSKALKVLKSQPIDIVLMDIHMPVMDGIEATLTIRSEQTAFQSVKIIALTADPQYQQIRICKNIGMNDALGKPVTRQQLLEAIQTVWLSDDEIDTLAQTG